MSHRLLFALFCGLSLMAGVVTLPSLTADEAPPPMPPAAPAAEYKLAYKFQPNQVVRYETVQKAKFVSQFRGNVETANSTTETKKAYRVVKVHAGGSADLELVIEWVRMKADFGGDAPPIEFDSSNPKAKTQKKFQDVLKNVGKPQTRLACSPCGKVLKVKEMALVAAAPIGVQDVTLKNMTGRDDYNFLTVFPEKPIQVGETWVEKMKILVTVENNLTKSLDAKRTYRLKSVEGDVATITFRTTVLDPVRDNNIAIQLIQRETSGELSFDMALGAVIARTVDTDKSLINPAGDNTAMHSTSHLLERIMTAKTEISDIPAASAKQ